jgi:hypothetical protein
MLWLGARVRSLIATMALTAALAGGALAAPGDTVEEEAQAAAALAANLRAGLHVERCLTTEDALAVIQQSTEGVDVQTIAAAIDLIENDAWCPETRAAIASAEEAAQLAMAQSGATGGVGGAGGAGVPFGAGGVGSPGGGGGSNYPG